MSSLLKKLWNLLKYICEWERLPNLTSKKRELVKEPHFFSWLFSRERLGPVLPKLSANTHKSFLKWLFSMESFPVPRNLPVRPKKKGFFWWLFSIETLPASGSLRVRSKKKGFLKWLLGVEDLDLHQCSKEGKARRYNRGN